jgi:hypothetical protein
MVTQLYIALERDLDEGGLGWVGMGHNVSSDDERGQRMDRHRDKIDRERFDLSPSRMRSTVEMALIDAASRLMFCVKSKQGSEIVYKKSRKIV